jgi:hypothetical protein
MSNDKYELTSETKQSRAGRRVLHRIRALRDIGSDVKMGDLGGWIECELNLATFGECWIYNDACSYYNGRVSNNARMRDRSENMGGWVIGDSEVRDDVYLCGNGKIMDHAKASERVQITGNSCVFGYSDVSGDIQFRLNQLIGPNVVIRSSGNDNDFPSPVAAHKAARDAERAKAKRK